MPALRLRPLTIDDGPAVIAGHRVMAGDDFEFALGYVDGMPWSDYLAMDDTARAGAKRFGPPVPSTFLVAEVAGVLVGRVSIRHELNDWLAHQGGHIGAGVLPEHRRRGYAAEILRQSLIIARSHGVSRVLVTCDDDNLASRRTIEASGGVLEATVTADTGQPVRRYWFD